MIPIAPGLKEYVALLLKMTGWRLYNALLLLVLSGMTEGAGLLLLLPFLNSATSGPPVPSIPGRFPVAALFKSGLLPRSMGSLLLVGLFLILLRALLTRQREMAMARLRLDFMQKLQVALFQAAESAKWAYWVRQRNSAFQHVLTSEVPSVGQGTYYILHFCVTLVLMVVYLLVAMQVSLWLTAGTFLASAAMFWGGRGRLYRSYIQGQSIDRASDRFYEQIGHFSAGLKFTKSHGEAARFTQELTQSAERFYAERLAFVGDYQKVRAVMEISVAAGVCGFVYMAVTWLHLATASIMLLILIFARMMPMTARIFSEAQHVCSMLPAFRSILAALNDCERAALPQYVGFSGKVSLLDRVCFRGVSVRYENEGKLALDGVDCVIPARQITALIGPSGAGKTTFVDLLAGLLQPESGQILVDGQPLQTIHPVTWGKRISYLPQDGFLFYGSIRDNVAYLAPGSADAELWEALRLAAADTFVRELPSGLDTLIGDQGITLSGGERQRLAFARAFLRQPDLLILDEATSALDGLNEQHIQAALSKLRGKTTVVLIAHRMATVRHADQIIVLDGGQIRGCGRWQDLCAQNYFQDAVMAQAL